MLDNHVYNLLAQIVEEHKSLWRIKNKYLSDAPDCSDCQAFYSALAADKEAHITKLQELVKKHLI